MKLVKASAIALAVSAMLAGPVLAQGAASDTQIRGGAQGRSQHAGRGVGQRRRGDDVRAGAPGEKAGVHAKLARKARSAPAAERAKGTARGTDPATGKRH